MASLVIDDFSGGLNTRDSPNQLKPNETPACANFTLDERGALKRRNGCANVVALPGVTGTKADIFYSAALDLWFCARETSGAPNTLKLFTRPGDLSGSWTDRGTINSVVSARAAFVDFPGNPALVVIATDVNSGGTKGIWTYNAVGPALTNVSTTVSGNAIALWQDRAIVAGYPTSDANGNPTRFFACKPKDPSDWTTSGGGWNNDVRELDAKPLTGLGIVGGALVIFKKRSAYRVNDSATGAYTTIDAGAGCVNPRAVAALRGRLYAWGADGLYECDGMGRLKNVGDKIRPQFATANPSLIVAGVLGDNLFFWVLTAGYEYSPANGWLVLHGLPAISQNEISSFASKDGVLYAAVYDGDDLFKMFTEAPGTDDATGFQSTWESTWLLPNSGMLARLNFLRVQGKQTGSVAVTLGLRKNWNPSGADLYPIEAALATSNDQAAADLRSLGHGTAFKVEFLTDTAAGSLAIRAIQLIDQSLAWPSPGYPKVQGAAIPNTPPPPVPTGRR